MSLADFENLLKASIGLNVASIGPSAIERAVQERLAACDLEDRQVYWERVRSSTAELQQLIEAVVVPETWFFRDRESFAALGRFAQDERLRRPDALLSLLSLPCSTGEEPYSMAMALVDAAIPAERFRIDAVDISARALAVAERGVYGRNSFRGDDLAYRDRHFDPAANGYRVSEMVRRQVRFQQGNLFAEDFFPGVELYDVVFCRNVLIYFDRATQDRAIVLLKRLLRTKGLLFVAPAETGLPSTHGFVASNMPLSFAFSKVPSAPLPSPKAVVAPVKASFVRRPAPPSPPPAGRPATPRRPSKADAPASTASPAKGHAAEPASGIAAAKRLADQGHFVEAATTCEAHIRAHGPSAEAFHLLGLVRDATGNAAEAIGYYRKALYLDPNHHEALAHLALLSEKQGDAAGAQLLRSRARRLTERQKDAHD